MTQTALTYGSSLFDLAVEENALHCYMEELSLIRDAVNENPRLLDLLDCLSIPGTERLTVLDTCFAGKVQPYLLNFMKILCEKRAIRQLPACIRRFEILYNRHCGIMEATAIAAVELSAETQDRLVRKLEQTTGKTVKLRCRVDPSVLGGIRLEMEGTQLDGTVRRRLDEVGKLLSDLTL